MSRPATSFQKKPRGASKRVEIPGTKPSIHNNQLLISTGIPSLDFHLGGGVAVGTLILIEEDDVGSFAHLMLKYFVAEGVVCGHSLFLAAKDPSATLSQIPEPILQDGVGDGTSSQSRNSSLSSSSSSTSTSEAEKSANDQELKIAWRYRDVNKQDGNPAPADNKFGHYFDLNRTAESSVLDSIDKRVVDLGGTFASNGEMDDYELTLRECSDFLEKEGNFVSSQVKPEARKICRIAVHSTGSPLWNSSNPHSLSRFFFRLKHLLRQSFACAVVTVPKTVLPADKKIVASLRHLGDYVVNLRSFAGTDDADNPALKDYHGLFQIVKLPRLNSLNRFAPSTFDLAFKLRRKRFTVEKLHLPPDLAETAEREQDESAQLRSKKKGANVFGGGCGGMNGGSGSLDF